ncbi:hypothetical protein QFC21_007313 [Naganishia friedmannii]|uniref:Uncharacterized protein n=1 Tax=Naganishia friedmannii TaxID=89922 RepID=A0ACC2UWF8_9TREE|nr:hypothetical protein QFC21_007313 [Naganishia friedmannii]
MTAIGIVALVCSFEDSRVIHPLSAALHVRTTGQTILVYHFRSLVICFACNLFHQLDWRLAVAMDMLKSKEDGLTLRIKERASKQDVSV